MAVGKTFDDTPTQLPASGLLGQHSAKVPVAGSEQDEITKPDDQITAVRRFDDANPAEPQRDALPNTKTADFVLRIEDERDSESTKPQDGETPETEPIPHPRRSTAGYWTNWLLILISFLGAYSIYTYDDGIPDDEMTPLDHLLRRAMGRFWNPSPGALAAAVAVFAWSTAAVARRQASPWITTVGLSGALAHVPVGAWFDGWRATLLRDLPVRLTVAPLFLQLAIPLEAWTGWDVTRERRMRAHAAAAERERRGAGAGAGAGAEGDCEAQETGGVGGGGGGGEPLMEGGGRPGAYGAC